MNSQYLTEDEQYKSMLNRDEISRIRDPRLREIRRRYFESIYELLNTEHSISNEELSKALLSIEADEQAEIEKYKQMIAEKDTLE